MTFGTCGTFDASRTVAAFGTPRTGRPPRLPRAARTARPAAWTAAVVLTAAACGAGGGDVEVTAPEPRGEAAEACRELAGELPERVEGEERADLAEESEYVAAWGDPAIVLRCGVARPAVLTPESDSYNPLVDGIEVDGVAWVVEEQPPDEDDAVRFTTTGRTLFVEVTVPGAYAPEVNPLVDLAEAVDARVPLDPLWEDPMDPGSHADH